MEEVRDEDRLAVYKVTGNLKRSDLPTSHSVTILDSGATLHVCGERNCLTEYRPSTRTESVKAGVGHAKIGGWGTWRLPIKRPDGKPDELLLRHTAYCTDFEVNLVSFQMLKRIGIFWDTVQNTLFYQSSNDHFAQITNKFGHEVLSEVFVNRVLVVRTAKPRPTSVEEELRWHKRLGHPSPEVLAN